MLENYINGNRVHMLGIGGISMSGIAVLLKKYGYVVTGTNNVESEMLDKLRSLGIDIETPHFDKGLEEADIVVYTAAIKPDDSDMIKARSLNKKLVERSEFWGKITEEYAKTIAISGMHGKTTTTSMIGVILENANIDPTILVGGEVEQLGGNYRVGNSDVLVVEACEYVESFTKCCSYVGVVCNIELEHMDYYKDINHIKSAFSKFIDKINPNGYLVANVDDENVLSILDNRRKTVTFGIDNNEADWTAKNIEYNFEGFPKFDVYNKGKYETTINLKVLGKYNIYNALSAIVSTNILGVSMDKIKDGLEIFNGTKRRFEYKGNYNGVSVYDDYAHHPSEIKATLSSLKNKKYNRLWCVFQPHTFSRTITLFDEFSKAFVDCDNVLVLDIYSAREVDTGEVSSKMLVDSINKVSHNATYVESFEEAKKILLEKIKENDILLTMGAGEAFKVGESILKS